MRRWLGMGNARGAGRVDREPAPLAANPKDGPTDMIPNPLDSFRAQLADWSSADRPPRNPNDDDDNEDEDEDEKDDEDEPPPVVREPDSVGTSRPIPSVAEAPAIPQVGRGLP
jgi:hypothetical protein